MKTRGMRTFGALFLVLLFFMGALSVHPGWSAQAEGKKIWGIVRDDNGTAISATVTLTEVHSLENYTATTQVGVYIFVPPTGYYGLKVEAPDYFTNGTEQPFRYDGTEQLVFNFYLTPFPKKDKTLNVLVTEEVGTLRNEAPYFQRGTVSAESVAPTYNSSTQKVTLSKKPVVRVSQVKWEDKNLGFTHYLETIEYTVDQWAGTIKIRNNTFTDKLNVTAGSPYFVYVDYTYTAATASLNYTPMLSNYTVKRNGIPWPAGPDWTVDINMGKITINQNFVWGTDSCTIEYSNPRAIQGATVALYNSSYNQQLMTLTTNSSGGAGSFSLWTGRWEVRVSKPGTAFEYQTNITTFFIVGGETVSVRLPFAVKVTGVVADSEGPVTDGVVAFLYSRDNVPLEKKVLRASVEGPGFSFKAYPGRFKLVVDADWHKGKSVDLDVPTGAKYIDSGTHYLEVSLEEKASTTVIFERAGWNNLTVYSNHSYTQDSTMPGLLPADMRNVDLQIDYTFGVGTGRDGMVSGGERALFYDSLEENGTAYIDTSGLLTTNSLYYLTNKNSDVNHAYTEFAVNVTGNADYPYIIQTVAYYDTKGTDILSYGKPTYYLNFTGVWDTNTTVYRNKTYTIDLPKRYELTETTFVSPGLEMKNFTRIDLDPKEGTGSPRADMIIKLSANGTARARVKGPVGHFQELNTTLTNYTAVVMAGFNITYSADQSTDPIGKIDDANFTWQFEAGPAGTRYTMDPVYNYTIGGEYSVNLTLREAGGNFTYRNFKIIADNSYPVARLWTNISAGGTGAHANGTTIRLNQSVPVRFDSVRSIDYTYSNKAGTVSEAHWDFDGDGIEDSTPPPGKIVNNTFEKPGQFTLKMWVIDGVGHRSVNATMTVVVNDTAPPSPDFTMYDSTGTVVTSLIEDKTYNFNASSTTDNYDSLDNLTFTWTWGDGGANETGTGYAGYNRTHTYSIFNNSYRVKLNVTDKGFQGKTPNYYVLEKAIVVQVDSAKRPNVAIESGSLTVNPSNPEEGSEVTVTVTVTNEANRGYAYSVGLLFFVRTGTTYNPVQIAPSFFKSGAAVNNSIPAGEERQVQFVWKADTQGVRAIRIKVTEPSEPYTWETDNTLDSTVSVREAGWKGPVIWGLIAFFIFGIPIIYWVVKKFRAGEWSLRREKSEEGEEGKPEKEEVSEKAEKKEKKRL